METLQDLKHIGPYLSGRFAAKNIHTMNDLVIELKKKKNRDEITQFLTKMLQNRRKGKCVRPSSKRPHLVFKDGFGPRGPGKYHYCIRNVNAYGWRAISTALRNTNLPKKLLPPIQKPRSQFCPPSYCQLEAYVDESDFGGEDITPLPEPLAPPEPKKPYKPSPKIFGVNWNIENTGDLEKDMMRRFQKVKVVAGRKRRKRLPTPREKKKALAVYTKGILNGKDSQLTWPVLQLLVKFIGLNTEYRTGSRRGQLLTKCELARALVRHGMGTKNWKEVGPGCQVPQFHEPIFPQRRTYSRKHRQKYGK